MPLINALLSEGRFSFANALVPAAECDFWHCDRGMELRRAYNALCRASSTTKMSARTTVIRGRRDGYARSTVSRFRWSVARSSASWVQMGQGRRPQSTLHWASCVRRRERDGCWARLSVMRPLAPEWDFWLRTLRSTIVRPQSCCGSMVLLTACEQNGFGYAVARCYDRWSSRWRPIATWRSFPVACSSVLDLRRR